MKMTTAAVYARVSTGRQEQERTIQSQIDALMGRAVDLGWDVPERYVFSDEGWSGARLDRPGLDGLRDAAADGFLDAVLVYDPDRLARSYVHQQVLLEELEKRCVHVEFVQRPISDKPEDRLLVQMQGVFAEYERTKILERTRRGRLHKARTTAGVPWWVAPYGYRFVTDADGVRRAEIEPVEAEWVVRAYRWILDDGHSSRKIAKLLNEHAIKPRRAKFWTCGMVYRMLTNPTYAGTAYYNRTRTVEPKKRRKPGAYTRATKTTHKLRPKDQWIPIPVPALVTEDEQVAVKKQLAANKWRSPRNTRRQYLLRTLVVCGRCGLSMNVEAQRAKNTDTEYLYYSCYRRHPVDDGRAERCGARRVRADRLDSVVWSDLVEWLQRPEVLRAELRALQHAPSSEAPRNDAERLRGTIRTWETQIERLLDAYQAGAIELDQFSDRRDELASRVTTAQERLQDLEALRTRQIKVDQIIADVDVYASALRAGLADMPFETRQRVVRLLVERVVVTGEDVTIEHVVPLTGRFSGLRTDDRVHISPVEGVLLDG